MFRAYQPSWFATWERWNSSSSRLFPSWVHQLQILLQAKKILGERTSVLVWKQTFLSLIGMEFGNTIFVKEAGRWRTASWHPLRRHPCLRLLATTARNPVSSSFNHDYPFWCERHKSKICLFPVEDWGRTPGQLEVVQSPGQPQNHVFEAKHTSPLSHNIDLSDFTAKISFGGLWEKWLRKMMKRWGVPCADDKQSKAGRECFRWRRFVRNVGLRIMIALWAHSCNAHECNADRANPVLPSILVFLLSAGCAHCRFWCGIFLKTSGAVFLCCVCVYSRVFVTERERERERTSNSIQ